MGAEMRISFNPVRMDKALALSRKGDVLVINGEALDLSGIPEGAVLPREAVECEWLASDIARVAGVLEFALILPHGARAPQETLFAKGIVVMKNGVIKLPPYDAPVKQGDAA